MVTDAVSRAFTLLRSFKYVDLVLPDNCNPEIFYNLIRKLKLEMFRELESGKFLQPIRNVGYNLIRDRPVRGFSISLPQIRSLGESIEIVDVRYRKALGYGRHDSLYEPNALRRVKP